jgi:superoxide dismutase
VHLSAAVQPVISAEIMELHHKKHHQTYVNTFNTLAEQLSDAEGKNDVAKMIALQGGLKFNGGGAFCAHASVCTSDHHRHPAVLCFTIVVSLTTSSVVMSGDEYAGHVNHSMFWKNLTPPKVWHMRHAFADVFSNQVSFVLQGSTLMRAPGIAGLCAAGR